MLSVCGSCRPAAVIAACTSCAAASTLRVSSNCKVIEVEPSVLVEVICVTPAIWPNWRSSGAATVAAIVSGLAPGNCAETEMVGKSTCGSGATGSSGNVTMPISASAADSSAVAIGRRMKGSEMLMRHRPQRRALRGCRFSASTRVPACRRYCPLTTTFSPAASPRVTITVSPSTVVASRLRCSAVLSPLITQA